MHWEKPYWTTFLCFPLTKLGNRIEDTSLFLRLSLSPNLQQGCYYSLALVCRASTYYYYRWMICATKLYENHSQTSLILRIWQARRKPASKAGSCSTASIESFPVSRVKRKHLYSSGFFSFSSKVLYYNMPNTKFSKLRKSHCHWVPDILARLRNVTQHA